MFNLDDIKTLHMETSSVCNAACPACRRETVPSFDKELHPTSLSLAQTQHLFSPEFIKRLNSMYMCGHFGDPAAAPDCIDIFKYFQDHNPACNLGIISNGSLRNESWWSELANVLNNSQQHYADFSIDGLADTNHIYRKNTDFNKIIRNASAFIKAGGKANWVMLVFKHNQHQVEQARELSQELGFSNFTKKVSRRFGMFSLDNIEPPDGYKEIYKEFPVTFVKPSELAIHKPTMVFNNPIDIQCSAIKEKSLAVTANGQIIPCGFIYRGPNQDPRLTELLGSKNFQSLVDTWTTRTPYYLCENTCNILNNNPANMKFFDRQWGN